MLHKVVAVVIRIVVIEGQTIALKKLEIVYRILDNVNNLFDVPSKRFMTY